MKKSWSYLQSLSDRAAEDRRHHSSTTFMSNPAMNPDELALEMQQNYDRADRVREMEDSPYSPFSLPSSQKWS